MSAALTRTDGPPGPLKRLWRRAWLAYRVRQAERDQRALAEQMQRDLLQLEFYSAQMAAWRAEIAYHQEPTRQEGA